MTTNLSTSGSGHLQCGIDPCPSLTLLRIQLREAHPPLKKIPSISKNPQPRTTMTAYLVILLSFWPDCSALNDPYVTKSLNCSSMTWPSLDILYVPKKMVGGALDTKKGECIVGDANRGTTDPLPVRRTANPLAPKAHGYIRSILFSSSTYPILPHPPREM